MSTPLKLLYVDDDPDIRTIVRMSLALDPTIAARTAESGADALRIAAEPDWRPDILVLDVMMPGMDGVETLRALRELPGFAATPAIFMTAKGRQEDIARYHAEGAAGVILKPFDPLQLATEIRTLAAR
jgi:CheY-like chemotaxis protein